MRSLRGATEREGKGRRERAWKCANDVDVGVTRWQQ
jgi:hypothetical protein